MMKQLSQSDLFDVIMTLTDTSRELEFIANDLQFYTDIDEEALGGKCRKLSRRLTLIAKSLHMGDFSGLKGED